MDTWAGIALALRGPDDDGMRSRLPTYLHPLAGRSLVWHVLHALAALVPAPRGLFLASTIPVDESLAGEQAVTAIVASDGEWWPAVERLLDPGVRQLLVVDAAAVTLSESLDRLRGGPPGRALVAPDEGVLAVWIDREALERRQDPVRFLGDLVDGLEVVAPASPAEAFVVRDRARLARAGTIIRDRIVGRLLAGGVTFLLPETVLVDVDVTIGADSVIYPGVALEGRTTIGSETVVGPGCRIVDSWIGSGVELKGWNYIVGASVRNRAVLEPYVRRGFD